MDTIVAILGLNASEGWRRDGEESEVALWLRYLTPVLAETRQSAAALAVAARGGLPGDFEPPIAASRPPLPEIEPEPIDWPDEPEAVAPWKRSGALIGERVANWLRDRRVVVAAGLVLAAALALWALQPSTSPDGNNGVQTATVSVERPPRTPDQAAAVAVAASEDPAGDDYRAALAVTLEAATQAGGTITPRALAAVYAGESDRIEDPATFLATMLRRWPLPPDAPIERSDLGRAALEQFAMAFVATERGASTAAIPPTLSRGNDEDSRLQTELSGFATPAAPPEAASGTTVSSKATWPSSMPLLAFLPVLVALGWSGLTLLPAIRAALTNPSAPRPGTEVQLPVGALVATAPPPARRLARQISWREPGIARRIHAERSVQATIRRGGFLTLVPRRRPRPADYLFLVPRLRREDHERDRVSRFIEALQRGGLALDVYDYDPDPRTLFPRKAGVSGRGGPVLDLRALRERHSEARLVLVTDGTELVDYFTQRPYDFVNDELALWPARMLLTPVPMGEWGEREMNLADALGALVGRATPDGFRDLATAFDERARPPPRPRLTISEADAGERGLVSRILAWLAATEQVLGSGDSVPRRPPLLRFDDPMLYSDAEPPPADQAALISELREWLGTEGFQWLAACAAYPQLRFAITLYLGLAITISYGPVAVPLYDERRLAQLSLLPWFRIGRIPLWLRKALMASLPPPARQRIRFAVDGMLNGAPLPTDIELPEGAHLPIWRPEAGGTDIPLDAVMADLLLTEASDIVPMLRGGAFSAIFRQHLVAALANRFWVVFATALWCAGAWWFWPAPTTAPHPAGAWLPLATYVAVTTALAVIFAGAGWLRQRRADWQPAFGLDGEGG